jgi:DNA-directed RNA polymerase subunit RPC12/RpoP
MAELKKDQSQGNVNVTLAPPDQTMGILTGKEFPCPLCGAGLPILTSKRNKPYCTCNDCGLQIFMRGKNGILRLEQMAQNGILISATEESAAHGISLLNRLEQLRLQRGVLEEKQGIFFPNKNVGYAISLVDAEMEVVQGELARMSRAKQKESRT